MPAAPVPAKPTVVTSPLDPTPVIVSVRSLAGVVPPRSVPLIIIV